MRRSAVVAGVVALLVLTAAGLVGSGALGPILDGDAPASSTPDGGTADPSGPTTAASATASTPTPTPTSTPARDSDGDGLDDGAERAEFGTDPELADTDGDGLADGRELELGTDPTANDTDGDGLADGRELALGTNATNADTDDDGIGDAGERERGTNATVADTDADGLADGRELELGTDPVGNDTDGDGLADGRELNLGTNATRVDSDGDGLSDGREVALGADPTVVDTDGDTIPDGREVELGTNATAADTDGDGLDDARERDLGVDPTANDTDADGLDDGAELERGTDPTVGDTDGDGLADGREVDLGTNATNPDTDDDALSDGEEVAGESEDGAALPEANPRRMDLYVQISVSNGSDGFTDDELSDLAAAWADMPVENPDGSTGITLHTVQTSLDETLVIDEEGDYERFKERFGSPASMGNRSGVYHHLLLLEIEREYIGRGASPGTFAVADAGRTAEYAGLSHRVFTGVHELLHNVVGRLDEDDQCPEDFDGQSAAYHTCTGWLSYDLASEAQFLPEPVAAEIEEDGLLKR